MQVSSSEIGVAETTPTQICTTEVSTRQINLAEIRSRQVCPTQVNMGKVTFSLSVSVEKVLYLHGGRSDRESGAGAKGEDGAGAKREAGGAGLFKATSEDGILVTTVRA